MSGPLLNWLYFLGFLGVVLAVIFLYWWVLNRVFDWARKRQQEADQELQQLLADMREAEDMKQRKVLNAAISWKVKPR